MADPYRFFRIEAIELTDAIEAGLLELERGEGSLGAACRCVSFICSPFRIPPHRSQLPDCARHSPLSAIPGQ